MISAPDGFEVCRRMRAEGRSAPVLMLTARDGVPDRVRGLDAGADDYLTKPFALAELFARVRALARRNRWSVRARGGPSLTIAAVWAGAGDERLVPVENPARAPCRSPTGVRLPRAQVLPRRPAGHSACGPFRPRSCSEMM